MDFGELKNDTDLISKVNNIQDTLTKIDSKIDVTVEFANYEDLSTEEKVKYDLYLSYSINSLYWTYCKLQGIDVNNVSVGRILWTAMMHGTRAHPNLMAVFAWFHPWFSPYFSTASRTRYRAFGPQ